MFFAESLICEKKDEPNEREKDEPNEREKDETFICRENFIHTFNLRKKKRKEWNAQQQERS